MDEILNQSCDPCDRALPPVSLASPSAHEENPQALPLSALLQQVSGDTQGCNRIYRSLHPYHTSRLKRTLLSAEVGLPGTGEPTTSRSSILSLTISIWRTHRLSASSGQPRLSPAQSFLDGQRARAETISNLMVCFSPPASSSHATSHSRHHGFSRTASSSKVGPRESRLGSALSDIPEANLQGAASLPCPAVGRMD